MVPVPPGMDHLACVRWYRQGSWRHVILIISPSYLSYLSYPSDPYLILDALPKGHLPRVSQGFKTLGSLAPKTFSMLSPTKPTSPTWLGAPTNMSSICPVSWDPGDKTFPVPPSAPLKLTWNDPFLFSLLPPVHSPRDFSLSFSESYNRCSHAQE